MHDTANSNRKKASKLQAAKKAKTAEKEKTVKKTNPAEEKSIKYTVTAEQQNSRLKGLLSFVEEKADLISLSRRIKH